MKKIIFVVGLGMNLSAYADPVSLNPRPRMMGMGNAGAGLVGDSDSAMVNPAGLADVESSEFQILPIMVMVPLDVGLVNSYLDTQETLDGSGTEDEKRAAFEEFLSDVASEAISTRVNVNPSYTRKNLHIGLSLDFLVDPRFRVGGATSNQVVELGGSNANATIFAAYAYSFLNNRLKVGATLKPIYKADLTPENEQTVYDLVKGQDPDTDIGKQLLGDPAADRRGFGVGFDLGLRYDIPFIESWRPSVGLTFQDIGNTRFFGSNGPRSIDQSLSMGLGFHKQFGIVSTAFALDFRNMNENQEFLNKFHMGVEAMIWKLLALRAGLSQAYWTVGLGLDVRFFEWDIFITAQEAGRSARLTEERSLGTRLALAF